MFVIFNIIEEGARGIDDYFSYETDRKQAIDTFNQADGFLQYGESLHLYELPNHTPDTLSEEVIAQLKAGDASSVDGAKLVMEEDYSFSEEAGETYSR